jgi:hypothetical protein
LAERTYHRDPFIPVLVENVERFPERRNLLGRPVVQIIGRVKKPPPPLPSSEGYLEAGAENEQRKSKIRHRERKFDVSRERLIHHRNNRDDALTSLHNKNCVSEVW